MCAGAWYEDGGVIERIAVAIQSDDDDDHTWERSTAYAERALVEIAKPFDAAVEALSGD